LIFHTKVTTDLSTRFSVVLAVFDLFCAYYPTALFRMSHFCASLR